jgi:peroxiredoxin
MESSSSEEVRLMRTGVLTRFRAANGRRRVGGVARRRSATLLVLLLTVVTSAACGNEAALPAVEPVDAPEVPAALRFRGPTLSDGNLDLTALAGQPVALWFWSASCSECAKVATTAEVLHQVYEDSAAVVGVTCGTVEPARRFEDDHELTFPTLLDSDGTFATATGIPCQPSWAFVATDGSVVVEARAMDFDELTGYVDAARVG